MKIGTAAKESTRDLLSRKKVSERAILEFKDESRNVLCRGVQAHGETVT